MDDLNAREVAERIIADLRDRNGIGDEWDLISEDVREEILECWTGIIMEGIE